MSGAVPSSWKGNSACLPALKRVLLTTLHFELKQLDRCYGPCRLFHLDFHGGLSTKLVPKITEPEVTKQVTF